MQRRRRASRRRANRGTTDADSVVARVAGGTIVSVTTIVSGTAQKVFSLAPNASGGMGDVDSRLSTFSLIYSYYRVKSVKVTFLDIVQAAYRPAAAFARGEVDTAEVKTFGSISMMPKFAMSYIGQSTPTTLHLKRSDLRGVQEWYDTATTTGDLTPGSLFFAAYDESSYLAVAQATLFHVEYEYEFKGLIGSGLSGKLPENHVAEAKRPRGWFQV